MGAVEALNPVPVEEEREPFAVMHARMLKGAAERIHADYERALSPGLIDVNGEPTSRELPPDMLPGADRDFGG